jgi:hypothetical protein
MGNTVWILSESNDSDNWDHTFMLKFEKSLNKLSKEIGVGRISDYYDNSILSEEIGIEMEPNLQDPIGLEKVFSSLIFAINEGKSEKLTKEPSVLEELEDCLAKIVSAKNRGEKVRVAIVP